MQYGKRMRKPHVATGQMFSLALPCIANFFLDLSALLFGNEPRDGDFDLRAMFLRLEIAKLDRLLDRRLGENKRKTIFICVLNTRVELTIRQ